ncbi:HGGxSTG domain-containing protein [Gymnodinialimonas sp.]
MCGAKTWAGHTCREKSEPGRKRCRLHGALSTCPRTQGARNLISFA